MKKLLVLLFLAAPLFAQSPFDGTWKTKLETAQFSSKPDRYLLEKGMYECFTCTPPFKVKADGTDQKVTGHPYWNMIAVRVVDDRTIEITSKKDGKTISTETETVSSDGNVLTEKFEDDSEAKPVTGEVTYTRLAKGPAGSHAYSGSWRVKKVNDVSSNGLSVTYQTTADGLKMSDQNGESYDAKFDGKEYPIEGDIGHTMVSLKRIGKNTIEETDHREGKIVGVSRMTVSPDGKSIHAVYTNKLNGDTTTFTMEKE